VLKSWAVTRGPSVDPADKRLAVMTEDHPMSYGDFEGIIPEKEYGGGTVMLWDRGTWEPLHDPEKGLEEGKLHFLLHGERMTGGWALVRMRRRSGEKRDNWLLIKERDAVAEAFEGRNGDVLTKKNLTSIKSGRAMKQIAADRDSTWSSKAKPAGKTVEVEKRAQARRRERDRSSKAAMPRFRKPQLATLVDEAPEGDDWLHEVKFDGYRLLAAIGSAGVRLHTRTGLDWTEKFPDVARSLEALGCDSALIDGEVMAADVTDGKSPFSALQRAIRQGGGMRYYAFDLLSLDGRDLTGEPLSARKAELARLLRLRPKDAVLHYSEHVTGNGPRVFRSVCEAGQEGIVSKRADAPYRGTRGRSWLKVKCTKRQEFVIGGYSRSDKKGRAFASLLVGTREGDQLVYRGRVGTGFSEETLETLGDALRKRERKTMPFASVPAEFRRGARWVTPDLVAEIDFAEFTDDGHIRHGAFLGLREDKEAGTVTLELKQAGSGSTKTGKGKASGDVDVLGVRISSPDRVVFPRQGVTKLDLARYHAVAGERMLVHLKDHPVSLVRCPQGRARQCFFQKHASDGFPDAIRRVPIKESSGETEDYMAISDAAGLVAAVQMGTMEFHIWGARLDRLEQPDRLVFDLDPDEGLDFSDVKRAAFDMRDRLDEIGLRSVAMVTGGKGVHVIVPLVRKAEWPQAKAFAKGVASQMAEEEPARFVSTMAKARRKGRIFIDWLRNERGATAVAPYSTRAREGAPVATPVGWDELAGLKAANTFHISDMPARLEASDPWDDAGGWRQSLTKAMIGPYL
jgi:bifunctional non-homologous end joining protein LigD